MTDLSSTLVSESLNISKALSSHAKHRVNKSQIVTIEQQQLDQTQKSFLSALIQEIPSTIKHNQPHRNDIIDGPSIPVASQTPLFIKQLLKDSKNLLKQKQLLQYEQIKQRLRNLIKEVGLVHFTELEKIKKPQKPTILAVQHLLQLIHVMRRKKLESLSYQWEDMLNFIRKKPNLFHELKSFVTKIENEEFDMSMMASLTQSILSQRELFSKEKSILTLIVYWTAELFSSQQLLLEQDQVQEPVIQSTLGKHLSPSKTTRFIIKKQPIDEKQSSYFDEHQKLKGNSCSTQQQSNMKENLQANQESSNENEAYDFQVEIPIIKTNEQAKLIQIDLTKHQPTIQSLPFKQKQQPMKIIDNQLHSRNQTKIDKEPVKGKYQTPQAKVAVTSNFIRSKGSSSDKLNKNQSVHKRTQSLGSTQDFKSIQRSNSKPQKQSLRQQQFSIRLQDLCEQQECQAFDEKQIAKKSRELEQRREELISKLSRTLAEERFLKEKIEEKVSLRQK